MTKQELETQTVPAGARRFNMADMSAPAGGGMAAINKKTGLPNGWYVYKGYEPPRRGWRYSPETMARLDAEGRLLFPKDPNGRIMLKRYLDEQKGATVGDVWTDISMVRSGPESRDYPTQKPLALLERIIAASTREGDVVLDPFAGCGTAIVAAERMGRRWIGIDITYLAINEVVDRLQTERREGRPLIYDLEGTPRDFDDAQQLFKDSEKKNYKRFEQWAVTLVKGKWNDKMGADRGIDGRIGMFDLEGNYRECLIQVKGGNALTLSAVRDFANVIESQKAVIGIMLAMKNPTKEMELVAEEMGYADWPSQKKFRRYQILFIGDVLEKGVAADLPEGYEVQPLKGVGRKVEAGQESLDFDGE